jgi:hypothetical protein
MATTPMTRSSDQRYRTWIPLEARVWRMVLGRRRAARVKRGCSISVPSPPAGLGLRRGLRRLMLDNLGRGLRLSFSLRRPPRSSPS